MEYVYQQQEYPANVVGVKVTISVIDSNGNYRDIGTATTNAMGSYGFTWTPDIPGDYDIIATFAGSNSYYQSSAETYFHVAEAAATPAPAETPAQIDPTMTIVGVGATILIAIAIVGVVVVMLLKKRPYTAT